MKSYNRRNILQFGALASLSLAGACTTTATEEKDAKPIKPVRKAKKLPFGPEPVFEPFEQMYAARTDNGFDIPAIPYQNLDEKYLRQVVRDPTGERAGTIVVNTRSHFLYLVLGNGKAIRYGVGLGRAGFEWSGRAEVRRKAVWPKWHPPEEMIEREPQLEKYRTFYDEETKTYTGGMDGGPKNPLGARALYLYENGVDTLYRLHGSPQWSSIGKSTSSGCVRLMNQDAIDLHKRVTGRPSVLVK